MNALRTEQCIECSKSFHVDATDLQFYQTRHVPVPNHCPDCRQQQRAAWRNELYLYQRPCDLCHKNMISLYSPDKPYTVYCKDCWWSDRWDPQEYGQEFDPTQPFFDQFQTLNLRVPQLGFISSHCENSDYCTYSVYYKNSYMCISGVGGENMYYSFFVNESTDSIDCANSWKLEKCYECIDSTNLHESIFCQDCADSSFLNFCYDCSGCSNCLGCVNLRNKQYYYFNEPISPSVYEQKLKEIKSSPAALLDFHRRFSEFKKKFPQPHARIRHSEQSSGNYIYNSKQARDCYDVTNVENSRYLWNIPQGANDVYDLNYAPKAEASYNSLSIVNGKFVHCSATSWDVQFAEYCWLCFYSNNLFGCVGIRHGQYYILNKKYSADEYVALVDRIKQQLHVSGEYGNFFPLRVSPFAYNESMAQQWFPLTETDIRKRDLQYQLESEAKSTTTAATDQRTCQRCNKSFRLIAQELSFYGQLGLPEPTECFHCRLERRLAQRNPRQLWQRQCMCTQIDHGHAGRCSTEFETTYAPNRQELIYCEVCYQKEIY